MVASRTTWVGALALGLLVVACASPAGEPGYPVGGAPGATRPPAAEPDPDPAPVEEPPTTEDQRAEVGRLVVYSGRSKSLVGEIVDGFELATGMDVAVRWGSTSELAATLLEEGEDTSADVFWAQDPGGLGAVDELLSPLPEIIIDQVPRGFRDPSGRWVGITGRARTVVYNTDNVAADDLPADLTGFAEPRWRGRVGWAPTNASFQAMVTAMRVGWGEDRARDWLVAMLDNDTQAFDKNSPIVAAVGAGEIDAGLVNHYYLHRFVAEEGPDFPARNAFLKNGGPGSLVLVAGAGILGSSGHREAAETFLSYLLSDGVQSDFAALTHEYPLAAGVAPPADLPALDELNSMAVDLQDLADLQGTVRLLRDVGAMP